MAQQWVIMLARQTGFITPCLILILSLLINGPGQPKQKFISTYNKTYY